MREPRFEVLWYEGPTEFDAVMTDFHTKESACFLRKAPQRRKQISMDGVAPQCELENYRKDKINETNNRRTNRLRYGKD